MTLTLAEIQARRAERKAEHEKAKAEQHTLDLAELLRCEEEEDFERVYPVHLSTWRTGAATMIVFKVPLTSDHHFRAFQRKSTSKGRQSAEQVDVSEELARACILYPSPKKDEEKELYEATIETAPGVFGVVENYERVSNHVVWIEVTIGGE